MDDRMDWMREVTENKLKDDTITCLNCPEEKYCIKVISKQAASNIYRRGEKGAAQSGGGTRKRGEIPSKCVQIFEPPNFSSAQTTDRPTVPSAVKPYAHAQLFPVDPNESECGRCLRRFEIK